MEKQIDSRVLNRLSHEVRCPHCRELFDLFSAVWCGASDNEPSKMCPHCDRCACELPAYGEPHFWKDAPTAFQKRGFRRLFLYYL
jgi:hypothetical protein